MMMFLLVLVLLCVGHHKRILRAGQALHHIDHYGPDGKKWQFFDEAAYDNVFGKNDSKELNNALFYAREESLGSWIVEVFSMSPPRGISFTTDSFTVGWDSMVNKDKASVLEYDLQCRVAPEKNLSATGGQSSPRNIEFFVDMNGNKSQRIFHECTNQFTSIPKESFRTKFNKVKVQGLSNTSLSMEFRVRLKSFAGWGPYSKLSEPLAPLPSSTFAPETKAITSRGVEIRWHPLKDQRYGRTIRYIP